MRKLEIACFNAESSIIAQQANADRVELCAGIEVGGTTPDIQTVKLVRQNLTIDLYVMIRPRGGDFVYSNLEFEQMKESISEIKKIGVNGFVFGILNENNTIDSIRNSILVELAKPFPCTFHRAFDEVSNYSQALEDVIACGFLAILTSGTAPNVNEGKAVLKELVLLAKNRITIMPGGGLRSSNISEIANVVNSNFYHSSAITNRTEIADADEVVRLKSNLKITTD
jgi:copper homeostasis protein